MSTGKTAALQLNQWSLSDSFLMEEFNEDNRKIDQGSTRLQGLIDAMPYVKLMDITTAADAQQVDVDFSGIDLSKYAMITFFGSTLSANVSGGAENSYYIYMRINNSGGCYSVSMYNAANSSQPYVARFARQNNYPTTLRGEISGFQSHPDAVDSNFNYTAFVRSFSTRVSQVECGYCSIGIGNTTPSISTINFLTDNGNYKIKKGSRFIFYGVKL